MEIYQNCPIFNDGTFSEISERSLREDRILRLQDGEPLLFGKEQKKENKASLHPGAKAVQDGIWNAPLWSYKN